MLRQWMELCLSPFGRTYLLLFRRAIFRIHLHTADIFRYSRCIRQCASVDREIPSRMLIFWLVSSVAENAVIQTDSRQMKKSVLSFSKFEYHYVQFTCHSDQRVK